jgi:hypothetical protein
LWREENAIKIIGNQQDADKSLLICRSLKNSASSTITYRKKYHRIIRVEIRRKFRFKTDYARVLEEIPFLHAPIYQQRLVEEFEKNDFALCHRACRFGKNLYGNCFGRSGIEKQTNQKNYFESAGCRGRRKVGFSSGDMKEKSTLICNRFMMLCRNMITRSS